MAFRGSHRAHAQLTLLGRLLGQDHRQGFWVVERQLAHRAAPVTRQPEAHRDRIERFFLPAHSPEPNPEALLDKEVKSIGSPMTTR